MLMVTHTHTIQSPDLFLGLEGLQLLVGHITTLVAPMQLLFFLGSIPPMQLLVGG